MNGSYAWPATSENNIVNQDPLFVLSPSVVNGPIDISATDFSITPNSPAIDAGDPSYTPENDFLGTQDQHFPMQFPSQVSKIRRAAGLNLGLPL